MLCEKCEKKEATFYYHENVNGNEKSYHLCADCAKELEKKGELGSQNSFGGMDLLFGDSMFSDPFKSMSHILSGVLGGGRQTEEKSCPQCHLRFRDFASSGMAGCPYCYEVFDKELESTIYKLHGHGTHRGRVPLRFRAEKALRSRVASLEKEQKEAIKREDYERAAAIRDELKTLRQNDGSAE